MKTKQTQTITHSPIIFKDYFEKKLSWIDELSPEQVQLILRTRYSEFFSESIEKEHCFNVQTVKAALSNLNANRRGSSAFKAAQRASEVIKEHFRIQWKLKATKNIQSTEGFLKLKTKYGQYITAHGVEEAKGGLLNVVLMCISGTVRAPNDYWGALVDGPPRISPVPHGPYFVVHNIASKAEQPEPNYPKIYDIQYVLVPCTEVANILKETLNQVAQHGLIASEELNVFKQKIVIYDELFGICEQMDFSMQAPLPQTDFFEIRRSSSLKRPRSLPQTDPTVHHDENKPSIDELPPLFQFDKQPNNAQGPFFTGSDGEDDVPTTPLFPKAHEQDFKRPRTEQ